MSYLTAEHTTPPRVITKDVVEYPVARLIKLRDTATLATLGIYPHEYYTGTDAPLGVEWQYDDADAKWVQVPIGTEEERADAAITQYRANLQCTPIQGELALIRYGEQAGIDLIGGYDAWRTAPERTREEKAWIERTQIWKRVDPNVLAGAAAVGLTDDTLLDQLFELAQTL